MRNARRYECGGELLTVKQIAERLGIARNTLDTRLREGMTIEQAMDAGEAWPRRYEYQGEKKTIKELAQIGGISPSTVKARLRQGMNAETALAKGRIRKRTPPKPKPKPKPEPIPDREPERMNRRAAAHCIINKLIYGEKLPIRMLADGTWIYKGGFCMYAVRFIDDGHAELAAYSRKTGGAIMRREFMIGEKDATEVPRCQPDLYFPTNG